MRKLFFVATCLIVAALFAKPLICGSVKLWVLPKAETFDFQSVKVGKEGVDVYGLSMKLPLGDLWIDEFHIPFSKRDKKVMRRLKIAARGFDPHPDLWFLKMGIDLVEGEITYPHLEAPVFFSAVDGILKLSPDGTSYPLELTEDAYHLEEAPLGWLSQFLEWPYQFTQGTISGDYAESGSFDIALSDFSLYAKEACLSGKHFHINDAFQIALEGGHLTYLEFDQDISALQKEDGEICLSSGDLSLLASLKKGGGIEGILNDEIVFTWDGHKGMIRGTAIQEDLYGKLMKLGGFPCQLKGEFDVEALYSDGDWTFDVTSYDGAYISPQIEALTEGSLRHQYSCRKGEWEGSFCVQGAEVRLPQKGLIFHEVSGEFFLEKEGLGLRSMQGKLKELDFRGEVRLTFDGHEGILSVNVEALDGHLSDLRPLLPFDIPLEGRLTGTLRRSQLQWEGELHLREGYGAQSDVRWEGVSLDVLIGEVVSLKNGAGHLILSGNSELITYRGVIDRFLFDTKSEKGAFDLRVEKSTHDIFRMSGNFDSENIYLNPESSHVFGAKIAEFEASYRKRSASLEMQISCANLMNHIEFLQGCGALPQYDIRKYDMQGEARLHLSYKDQHLQFKLTSEDLQSHKRQMAPFLLQGEISPEEIAIDKLHVEALTARLLASKDEEGWALTALEMSYKDSTLKSNEGGWKHRRGTMTLSSCMVNLSDFFPTLSGAISLAGPLEFDVERGRGHAAFMLSVDGLSAGDLNIRSQKPLEMTYSKEQGFELHGAQLKLRSEELWAEVSFDTLKYHTALEGEGVFLRLPPEMCLHLAEAGLIPCQREGNHLVVSGVPIKWENQIEAKGRFHFDKTLSIQGEMKDAYYWIGERSWPLQQVKFGLKDHTVDVSFKTEYQKTPVSMHTTLTLEPQLSLEIALRDQKGHTLKITGLHHQLIQKIEGEIWGLAANFYHNGKGSLVGVLKVNLPDFLEVMPPEWKEKLEPLEIGSGYEIAGEIVLAKELQFDGHLKGREFQFLGSRLKSLMGTLHIDKSAFHLTDLRLSDEALTLSLPELLIKQEEGKWHLTIPEVKLQDFRPSLLRKVNKYRGRMKPFIIRELNFEHIEGILGEKESFIGHGGLYFTNTFKTEIHFFDIPFELIARIGLDPRLLVPVKGKLDFEMRNGKIFLTELKHAYSEGKCSKFYLSQTRPSFITLDGQLDISIKMRQYVILKVTEPFILSIQGSVSQPKYSLR